jgi:hypothetical protein
LIEKEERKKMGQGASACSEEGAELPAGCSESLNRSVSKVAGYGLDAWSSTFIRDTNFIFA